VTKVGLWDQRICPSLLAVKAEYLPIAIYWIYTQTKELSFMDVLKDTQLENKIQTMIGQAMVQARQAEVNRLQEEEQQVNQRLMPNQRAAATQNVRQRIDYLQNNLLEPTYSVDILKTFLRQSTAYVYAYPLRVIPMVGNIPDPVFTGFEKKTVASSFVATSNHSITTKNILQYLRTHLSVSLNPTSENRTEVDVFCLLGATVAQNVPSYQMALSFLRKTLFIPAVGVFQADTIDNLFDFLVAFLMDKYASVEGTLRLSVEVFHQETNVKSSSAQSSLKDEALLDKQKRGGHFAFARTGKGNINLGPEGRKVYSEKTEVSKKETE
jgi:hypothetical protein